MHEASSVSVDYRPLFEQLRHPYLVLAADADFTIVAVNDAYLAATMTRREQVVGRALFEVFPSNPADRHGTGVRNLRASLLRVVERRRPEIMPLQRYDVRRPDGEFETRMWTPYNAPILASDGHVKFIVHHVEDVTATLGYHEREVASARIRGERDDARALAHERAALLAEAQRLADELTGLLDESRRETARLEEVNDFEQELIGIASHDLRNPISAIIAGCQMLLRQEKLDELQLRTAARMLSSAERASRLVNDLLDFTRARLGGGIPVRRAPTNVLEVVQHAVEELRVTNPERDILVEHQGDGMGDWDPDRISQVVSNLVRNAIAYSPRDTPVRVEVRAMHDPVEIAVRNEGEPIGRDRIPKLFQPMRAAAVLPGGRSIGLGLYIVDAIAKAHGGSVSVESSEREGTRFTVRLPRHPSE